MLTFGRRFIAIAASATVLTLVSSSFRLGAQETSSSKLQKTKPSATKKASDPVHRVPAYFGQLGLSEQQRESIFKVQAKHQPKIDDLEKQLDDARALLIRDCEKVLTPAQKTALDRRRREAAEKRKAASKEMEK